MIIVLFGQPASGKTTLAEKVQRELFIKENASYPIIDGDEIREIFKTFSQNSEIFYLFFDLSSKFHNSVRLMILFWKKICQTI